MNGISDQWYTSRFLSLPHSLDQFNGPSEPSVALSSIPSIRFGAGFLARTYARLVKDLIDIAVSLTAASRPQVCGMLMWWSLISISPSSPPVQPHTLPRHPSVLPEALKVLHTHPPLLLPLHPGLHMEVGCLHTGHG